MAGTFNFIYSTSCVLYCCMSRLRRAGVGFIRFATRVQYEKILLCFGYITDYNYRDWRNLSSTPFLASRSSCLASHFDASLSLKRVTPLYYLNHLFITFPRYFILSSFC